MEKSKTTLFSQTFEVADFFLDRGNVPKTTIGGYQVPTVVLVKNLPHRAES